MRRKTMSKSLCLGVLFAGCHPALPATPGTTPSVREMTLQVSDSTVLDVLGKDGSLTVRATAAAQAHVSVRLVGGCDEAFNLVARPGGVLRVEMSPSTKGQCREAWTVHLPAGVGVSARFDDADVDMTDVQGPVTLQVGHGNVSLLRVAGDVRAKVGNGDITASGAAPWRMARLTSQVGRVVLAVDGREVSHAREPGAGDWIEAAGDGDRTIRLEATVGRVSLRR